MFIELLATSLAIASLVFLLATYLTDKPMKESVLSEKVTSFCQSQNAFVFNITGSRRQRRGMPDLFIMHNKLPNCGVWVELKVADNKLSAIQHRTIRELHARGQFAAVLRYKDDKYIVENVDGGMLFNAPNLAVLWQELMGWRYLVQR